MPDTIKIASKLPMALRITEPVPDEFKDKPGNAPALKTAVINGTNTRGAGAEAVTEGIDADMFTKWSAAYPDHALQFRVMGDDEDLNGAESFGFEPALKAAVEDKTVGKKAEEGSTLKAAGPVKASDMAATSNVPNDDSPRSQTRPPGNVPQPVPAPGSVAPVPGSADVKK